MTTAAEARPAMAGRSDRRFRKFRRAYLARHPLCVRCAREGRTETAVELDHIVPLSAGGALFGEDNVQGLCGPCHTEKTAEDRGRSVVRDPAWQALIDGAAGLPN